MSSRKIALAVLVTAAATIGMSSSFATDWTHRAHDAMNHTNSTVENAKMKRDQVRGKIAEDRTRLQNERDHLRAKEAQLKKIYHHH
jgi:ssDNA-binding replication factor A large subunit